MDDTLDRPARRRYPFGFLGAIVLILAVELAIDHQKMASFGGSQWAYEVAKNQASSGVQKSEVLCFGDSLLKQGLAPSVIQEKSGFRTYNFAIAGGQAPGNYFLLRRALESGSRPAAIIVEYFPRLMAKDLDFNLENWPFLATPTDCLEMARLTRNPILLADLAFRKLFPSVRCRNSIRSNILTALNGTFPNFAKEILSARRNWEVNQGAEIVTHPPGPVDTLDHWVAGYFPKFDCTKANRAYIKKLLELASRNDIPVFWLLPPYQPALQARIDQSGFDLEHESFVRTLQARYPVLHVIDARRAGYSPQVFTDWHHLGRVGAAIFSSEVAGLLRNHHDNLKSTPRWSTLDGFPGNVAVAPLEDMDESRRKIVEMAAKSATSALR